MSDTDPEYIRNYVNRLPFIQRVIFRLFRRQIRKAVLYCASIPFQKGKINSAAMHSVVGVADEVFATLRKELPQGQPKII